MGSSASSATSRESGDWLHVTGEGDDNRTYEQPAKKVFI